jgi:hypothetical protein
MDTPLAFQRIKCSINTIECTLSMHFTVEDTMAVIGRMRDELLCERTPIFRAAIGRRSEAGNRNNNVLEYVLDGYDHLINRRKYIVEENGEQRVELRKTNAMSSQITVYVRSRYLTKGEPYYYVVKMYQTTGKIQIPGMKTNTNEEHRELIDVVRDVMSRVLQGAEAHPPRIALIPQPDGSPFKRVTANLLGGISPEKTYRVDLEGLREYLDANPDGGIDGPVHIMYPIEQQIKRQMVLCVRVYTTRIGMQEKTMQFGFYGTGNYQLYRAIHDGDSQAAVAWQEALYRKLHAEDTGVIVECTE